MLDKVERLDLKSKILNTIKVLSKKLLRALTKQKELHLSNGLMKRSNLPNIKLKNMNS